MSVTICECNCFRHAHVVKILAELTSGFTFKVNRCFYSSIFIHFCFILVPAFLFPRLPVLTFSSSFDVFKLGGTGGAYLPEQIEETPGLWVRKIFFSTAHAELPITLPVFFFFSIFFSCSVELVHVIAI